MQILSSWDYHGTSAAEWYMYYCISPNKRSLCVDITLVNSEGPGPYNRGFPAISAHFWPIFAYFEGNIPSESAGGAFIQAGAFNWQNTVFMNSSYDLSPHASKQIFGPQNGWFSTIACFSPKFSKTFVICGISRMISVLTSSSLLILAITVFAACGGSPIWYEFLCVVLFKLFSASSLHCIISQVWYVLGMIAGVLLFGMYRYIWKVASV